MDKELQKVIIELWHISRTALCKQSCSTSDRMKYIRDELNRSYPDLIEGMTPKKIGFAIEDAIA